MARERRDNKGRLLLTGEAQIRNGAIHSDIRTRTGFAKA